MVDYSDATQERNLTWTHTLHLKRNTERLRLVRNTSRHVKNKPLTVTLALTFGERTEARHINSTHSCAIMFIFIIIYIFRIQFKYDFSLCHFRIKTK